MNTIRTALAATVLVAAIAVPTLVGCAVDAGPGPEQTGVAQEAMTSTGGGGGGTGGSGGGYTCGSDDDTPISCGLTKYCGGTSVAYPSASLQVPSALAGNGCTLGFTETSPNVYDCGTNYWACPSGTPVPAGFSSSSSLCSSAWGAERTGWVLMYESWGICANGGPVCPGGCMSNR
jgi:hypothetical protein